MKSGSTKSLPGLSGPLTEASLLLLAVLLPALLGAARPASALTGCFVACAGVVLLCCYRRTATLAIPWYALVLFALAAAKMYAGSQGLYVVAGLSGLTDMDAITLSTARMAQSDPAIAADGWRLIVVAALANLVFKALLAGLLGGRQLLVRIAVLFAVPAIGGVAMLWLWPW